MKLKQGMAAVELQWFLTLAHVTYWSIFCQIPQLILLTLSQ